jgi:hypothetical protein
MSNTETNVAVAESVPTYRELIFLHVRNVLTALAVVGLGFVIFHAFRHTTSIMPVVFAGILWILGTLLYVWEAKYGVRAFLNKMKNRGIALKLIVGPLVLVYSAFLIVVFIVLGVIKMY